MDLQPPCPSNDVLDASDARVTHPRQAGRPEIERWVLRATPGCPVTQALLDGLRFTAADAIPLPTLGCHPATCRCHYEPLRDARGGERRGSAPRGVAGATPRDGGERRRGSTG